MRKFETLIKIAKHQIEVEQSQLNMIDKEIKAKTKVLYKKRKDCEARIKELDHEVHELEEVEA